MHMTRRAIRDVAYSTHFYNVRVLFIYLVIYFFKCVFNHLVFGFECLSGLVL